MTTIKPSDHGIVVDHVESGVRYAISDRNYDVKVHRKVRDLRPGESVLSYRPRSRVSQESLGDAGSPAPTQDATGDALETQVAKAPDTQTEGSAAADTKGK